MPPAFHGKYIAVIAPAKTYLPVFFNSKIPLFNPISGMEIQIRGKVMY
jgi:hypothetical protein